ncbi:unnamed protein product [Vicia faba]|uniref:Uncharacterized protein n=1 Tax=Vicia faba TaxID=3906 RepID=A0AAV0YC21_VICFA|nr:unnamed protein product [Vicia faba]
MQIFSRHTNCRVENIGIVFEIHYIGQSFSELSLEMVSKQGICQCLLSSATSTMTREPPNLLRLELKEETIIRMAITVRTRTDESISVLCYVGTCMDFFTFIYIGILGVQWSNDHSIAWRGESDLFERQASDGDTLLEHPKFQATTEELDSFLRRRHT